MGDEHETDPLLEEAADWFLRLQETPHDPATAGQFEAWLASSPEHARAWAKIGQVWQLVGTVPPAHEAAWRHGGQSPFAGRSIADRRPARTIRTGAPNWRRRTVYAIAAAACAVIITMATPSLMLRIEADHMTGTAESQVIALPDGSSVTLGAGSAIAAAIDNRSRNVTLLAGEAFFDVAHDADRPFTVKAGEVAVAVLGTTFDMQLSANAATVQLAHGSVEVGYDHAGRTGTARLSPGEMISVDRQTGDMSRSAIAQDDIAAWRSGHLFVTDSSIGSVVEQLQRYHPAWIKVLDSDLAAERVTGLYDLRDPDRALRALVEPYGGHVRTVSPYLRVLSRF